MIKNYNKIKYLCLIVFYLLILFCCSYGLNLFFIISMLIVWLLYYLIRVIWFKKNFYLLKKFTLLLLLEDIFIGVGFLVMYLTSCDNMKNEEINFIYYLSFIPFLVPSLIFHAKYKKLT